MQIALLAERWVSETQGGGGFVVNGLLASVGVWRKAKPIWHVCIEQGKCAFGHKVGDKIIFDGKSIKGDVCYSALMVLLPKVYAMRYGVEFPWGKDKDIIFNACPDADNPVVFEIRRAKK